MEHVHLHKRLTTVLAIGGFLTFTAVVSALPARGVTTNCTNGVAYTNNITLNDSYVSYATPTGNTPACISWTNTTTTTKTFNGNSNNGITITCDTSGCGSTCYCGAALSIQDGNGIATIKNVKIVGPFIYGIDASAEANNTLDITGNTISQMNCVGIVSSWKIEQNVIEGPFLGTCGFPFRAAAILFSPSTYTPFVRNNRVDCGDCTALLFDGTLTTGSLSPQIDHNFINTDVSSGAYIWDISNPPAKANMHDNVFAAKNDCGSPGGGQIILQTGFTLSNNVCDSTIASINANICNGNAAPFTLP